MTKGERFVYGVGILTIMGRDLLAGVVDGRQPTVCAAGVPRSSVME
jgi:hypothetical protein